MTIIKPELAAEVPVGPGDIVFIKHGDKIFVPSFSDIIRGILNTDIDLSFLLQLKKSELEILVACIRDRVDQVGD